MIILKITSIVFYLFMIYMNYLANAKPLGGISTGEISDKYPTLFTPAGFTFSIWGIIYLLVGGFVISSILINNYYETENTIVIYLFIVSTILNVLWLLCWHYDKIGLSVIVMIAFLIVLLTILQNILPTDQLGFITFSIYSGWISVALIANISILIVKYDISLFMNYQTFWFILILLISVGILVLMFIKKANYVYGLVFLWAYFGIFSKFLSK